jgi:hypothetical protein
MKRLESEMKDELQILFYYKKSLSSERIAPPFWLIHT